MLANILLAGATYQLVNLIGRQRMGMSITHAEVVSSGALHGLAFLLQLAAFGGATICFLAWFYRAHSNLPALGTRVLEFSHWSTVWWWIIPIASFICPCQVMVEIWKGSDPKNLPLSTRGRARVSAMVGWWWTLFLLMIVSGSVGGFIGGRGGTPSPQSLDATITANWWFLARSIIAVPAAVLAILVVLRVDANQQARYELIQAQAAAAPPPPPEPAADDFPFVAPVSKEPWTPPEDAGEYPRFT
jgi:hypothetical protein